MFMPSNAALIYKYFIVVISAARGRKAGAESRKFWRSDMQKA
jgi:hypothetical protein